MSKWILEGSGKFSSKDVSVNGESWEIEFESNAKKEDIEKLSENIKSVKSGGN